MPEHRIPLITTIAAGLVLAYGMGLLAHRLRIQPLVGYLVAGIVVGPFTPGFVADQTLATEFVEIGVILLMFGVGLHFSLDDLVPAARIAVPGAVRQIASATLMGSALAWTLGWSLGASLTILGVREIAHRMVERAFPLWSRAGNIGAGTPGGVEAQDGAG